MELQLTILWRLRIILDAGVRGVSWEIVVNKLKVQLSGVR